MSMKTIARGLVVACCAALGLHAWAGWSGTLSNTTPTKVLDGTSLADLDNMTFSGIIGGGWMGGSGKVFEHFFLDAIEGEGADAYRLCQMQINDYNHATDCHLKFVTLKFTLGEDGIYAVQSDQGYVQNKGPELIGQKVDRSSTTYTVSNIDYPNYVLKSLDVVTEIKINDGQTMTLTAENKPGADAIVYVNAGGTLDLHGIGETDFTLILNGGTVKNTGNGISNGTKSLAKGIIVRADSTIDTGSNFGTIAGDYALHNINLGNHTLTKTGANTLFLSNVEFNGAGTIKIEQGTVRIYNSSTNQYPDNDHPGHSMASSGLVVDVKIASDAKLECYGAPKFHSITGVSNESKGELYLFGAEGLKGIPGCFDVSKVILGGNKSTGYIGWNESAVELTINSTFEITQGSSNTSGTIKTLKGTGSITKTWSETPIIYVEDHSDFTGSVAEDIGVHLSIAKSETAYYYTIAQVKEAIATTDVTNISISDDDLAANGLKIVEGKIVAKTATEIFLEAINGDATEVTLAGDVAIESMITLTKDFAITLNGHTLGSVAEGKALKLIEVIGGATLTIDGTVEGSTVAGRINVGKNTNNNGNLVVNGGTFDVGENTAIHVNGTCKDSSVSLTGVTITTGDNGIQLSGNGTHTITDCSITGLTAVYVKAGTVSISNSTLTATGVKAAVTANNNGSDATGDAIVLDNCVPPYPAIVSVTIDAATTIISANGSAVLSYAREGNTRQSNILPAALKSKITEAVATEADLFDDYVEPSTDLPGADELPEGVSTSEYNEWAAANGVTAETGTEAATVAATAFVMGVTVAEGQTIAQAAALKADEMLEEITTAEGVDLAALLAQAQAAGAEGLVVTTDNTNLTVKLVPTTLGEGVETSANLFKLSITIKAPSAQN